jgi:hypothetical protein
VTKEVVFQITENLQPTIKLKDTKYKFVIPIGIRVAYSFFKLAHGANYLQCNELFMIGKSYINMVLHEFVFVMNVVFKIQICWP